MKHNHFETASSIVVRREGGLEELAVEDVTNLIRIANRAREKDRPTHPKTKSVEVSIQW